MVDTFRERGVSEGPLAAEYLLCKVLGCDRMKLFMDADRPASKDELAELRGLVKRALAHEPIQYLVGTWSFFGLELKVDQRALIPRPCTAMIPERVIQRVRASVRQDDDPAEALETAGEGELRDADPSSTEAGASRIDVELPAIRVLDIGTGTGAIALAIARNLPHATVIATDLHEEALSLARENAAALGLSDRVEFRQGNLFEPVRGEVFDFVLSNPPYIPDHEWTDVEANVKDHEPVTALRGGADGLEFVKPIVEQASRFLGAGGELMVEIASSTANLVLDTASGVDGLRDAAVLEDHEDMPRFFVACRSP